MSLGGYYCTNCGFTTGVLPEGFVTCRRCGNFGLRGYDNAKPRRIHCKGATCGWTGWNDGDVNDDAGLHLRNSHPERLCKAKRVPEKGWAVYDASDEKIWPPAAERWAKPANARAQARRLNLAWFDDLGYPI